MKTALRRGLLLAATVAIQLGTPHSVRALPPRSLPTPPHEAPPPERRGVVAQTDTTLPTTTGRQDRIARPSPTGGSSSPTPRPAHLQPSRLAKLNATPHGFIPNVGQLPDGAARFVLRDRGVSAYFTDRGFVLWNGQTTTVTRDGMETKVPVAPRWSLVGAKPVEPTGGKTFEHTVSYFRGNDPTQWHSQVPAYRDLHYPGILPGVDLRVESLHGKQAAHSRPDHPLGPNAIPTSSEVGLGGTSASLHGPSSPRLAGETSGFEYTFHIQPKAKPDLRFRYDGITGLETSSTGDLIVRTPTGYFTESRPVAFQWIGGEKRTVDSAFDVVSTCEYRIRVGAYDDRYELVIDPVLDWSTSVGGSYQDQINVIKLDPLGHVVVAGPSFSVNLPTTSGFAPFGTAAGESVGGSNTDVYVAKFSADGTQLLWAGYLGGDGPNQESTGRNKPLAIDEAGDVYLTTHTQSPDFPVLPVGTSLHQGGTDAAITKISSDGSQIVWSRLMGASGEDHGYAVAIHENDLYLSGFTSSPDFPVTARTFGGMQDAFIARLDATDGSVAWSSFLGGSRDERISALAADASGVILFGDTDSADFHAPDFPAPLGHDRTLGGDNDTFLTKLDPAGAILWSTYLGGSGAETTALTPIQGFILTWGLSDMTLDSTGNIIAAGHTYSTDFPGTAGKYQPALVGTMDGYVAKLTPDGSQVLWSTYLGGTGPHDRIVAVALNPWDEILVGGGTSSLDFPTTADALKRTMTADGSQDGFMAKLDRNGQTLLYSTYIGNDGWNDAALALTYDSGRVLVGGWHFDTFFNITQGAFRQECDNCGSETFLMSFLDAFIAHDGFEAGHYAGGEGDWAGAWTASGDVSILTSAAPHSGARQVRLRRGTGMLSRTLNIPAGTVTLQLGFWSKVHSFEGTEHANVRVSANGGTLSTVLTLTAAQSDNVYRYYEVDLTSLLPATQIQVTFDANMADTGDNWYLDDIRFTGTSGNRPPIADAGPDQSVTDVDNSGAEVITLDAAASADPDGSILSYEWKEGATVLGTSVSISPSLSLGIHTLTLTVTDNDGATASDTVQVTVNAPSVQPTQSHVGDLDGSTSSKGGNWRASVLVTIHNNATPTHQVVAGATVTGTWSGGFAGSFSATTDSNGRCSFTTGQMPRASTSQATFTITDVQHAALTYTASTNHDPDGDSNGTSITINKP